MSSLSEKLKAYGDSDYYGFHMPGHKRNRQLMGDALPYQLDITEIEGFDDLHHADGILKESQKLAAEMYHAEESHFLINGSTVGILSAILGSVSRGGRIAIARNCHRSVYHAIEIQGLEPVYLYPQFDSSKGIYEALDPIDVQRALKQYADIQAVVIVSPTYDGVVSDVAGIAEVVHQYRIPLIVDEAHGAHFGFHPYFPLNANLLGADIVIHSLHKTMPALTQTALLHLNGTYADRENVRRNLHMLQSSSPSYILMASMDTCMQLLYRHGLSLFQEYVGRLKETRNALKRLKNLRLLETRTFDYSKILISNKETEIRSKEIYKFLLNKYHLQMEMAAGTYILGMTSVGDTKEGFRRLVNALQEIDSGLQKVLKPETEISIPRESETVYTCAQMLDMLRNRKNPSLVEHTAGGYLRRLTLQESVGYISTEYAYLYPPGIPLLVPGERVTASVVMLLQKYRELDFQVEGIKENGFLEVWIDG